MFFKLAVFNVIKHRRRSLLIIFAVFASVLVMEVVAGMFHGIRQNFFENLTQQGGHVQISAQGRQESLNPYSLDYVLYNYRKICDVLMQLDETQAAEEVLEFGALVQYDEKNVTLGGVGLPDDSGLYGNVQDNLQEGEFPPGAQEAVFSQATADLLGLSYQDAVLVVVEDSSGSPFYLQYIVGGIFSTGGGEFDENTFFLNLADAQELLYLDGAVSGIRIMLDDPQQAEEFAAGAVQVLQDAGIATNQLELRSFYEIHSGLVGMIEMMDFFILFMNLMVIVIAASVITNAVLMNVFERIREFGTMRAIGLKRRGVVQMIAIEGLVQGILGSLLGLVIGVPVVLYFSVNGLNWGGVSEALGMASPYFYFHYEPASSGLDFLGGVLIALGGSLYAAWMGARLSVMEALRHG